MINSVLKSAVSGITEKFLRLPRFGKDELLFMQDDNLASPEALQLRDLGVQPLDIRKIAVKYIRHYRRAKFINEM